MMRLFVAAALAFASPVFAQAPTLGATATAVALFPLTAAFNDLRSKLALLSACLHAVETQRIAMEKRRAVAAELNRLILALGALTEGKSEFIVVVTRAQAAAAQRQSAGLLGPQAAADRTRDWLAVQQGARTLQGQLRTVTDLLRRSPALRQHLPADVVQSLESALKQKGDLDAAIRALAGGPADPAEDARALAEIAAGYIHCQRALVDVGDELRAMRRRLQTA